MDTREARRQRLKELAASFEEKQAFAKRIGKKPAQISQWLSGYRSINENTAREMERLMHKPLHWMDTLVTLPLVAEGDSNAGSLPDQRPTSAQNGQYEIGTVAPTVSWDQVAMNTSALPVEFHVVLADDAMAPRAPAGAKVKFSRSKNHRPGDAVLAIDSAGAVYFRECRLLAGGQWEAHATNPAYPSLRSDKHALHVIAVFVGIDTSWMALAL